MTQVFEQQLADVVSEYDERTAQGTDLDYGGIAELRTRCIAAVKRASGSTSAYCTNVVELRKNESRDWVCLQMEIGIAKALISDIRNGYLQSVEELLHGNVFGDYFEMAMHLLDNDYKDAAAVLTGGTLEVHLKNMCSKHSISTERNGKAKKVDELNAELAKQKVYSKLDQKNVTAWLGLRNDAAHGNYSAYTKDQVSLLLQSVRDFITRHPA